MFATFQGEEEEPVYGITKPLASWNPVWANVHYWVELARTARRASRLSDRVRVFLKHPGWRPEDLGGFLPAPEVDRATYRKYDIPAPRALKLYVLVQFVLVNLATTVFLFTQQRLTASGRLAAAAGIVAALASLGGLLDKRRWALWLELLRVTAIGPLGAVLLPSPRPARSAQDSRPTPRRDVLGSTRQPANTEGCRNALRLRLV